NIKPDQIPGLAQGRIFTGREALEFKLVDEIGGEQQAVEWLQKTHNVDKSLKVIDWKPEQVGSFGLLSRIGGTCGRVFGLSVLGDVLGRDPRLSTLGLDGLVSVWHPAE